RSRSRAGAPSSESSSRSSVGSNATDVSVQSASSVIEIEPTAGTFKRASALPQYFTSAKFARARARAASAVAMRLEPIDRVGDREARRTPAIAARLLGLAAREVHVLAGHPHAVERDARLAARDPRGALGADRDRVDEPVRQPHARRRASGVLGDDGQDLLEAHVLAAENVA